MLESKSLTPFNTNATTDPLQLHPKETTPRQTRLRYGRDFSMTEPESSSLSPDILLLQCFDGVVAPWHCHYLYGFFFANVIYK
jgi:hypothetical protein